MPRKKLPLQEEWLKHIDTSKNIAENTRLLQSLGFVCNPKSVKIHLETKLQSEELLKKEYKQKKEEIMTQEKLTSDDRFAKASKTVFDETVFNKLKTEWKNNSTNISFVRELHTRLSKEWIGFSEALLGKRDRGIISDTSIPIKERAVVHRLCVLGMLLKDIREGFEIKNTNMYPLNTSEIKVQSNMDEIFDPIEKAEPIEIEDMEDYIPAEIGSISTRAY